MRDINQVNLLHGITGVQNLLLITRYRLFQAIGASLWDLTFLCLRAYVACSFHLRPVQRIPAFEEQMQRRVFWQCYGVDRYVSTTLGRPFGIADDDIMVALPANLDDVDLKAAQAALPYASLDELVRSRNPSNALTEMSLAISHFQLRQISSRAFRDFGTLRHVVAKQNPPSATDSGQKSMTIKTEVWKLYYQHLEELLDWKSRSRRYQQAHVRSTSNDNSFLNDARWIDLHFHQQQLLLICLSMNSTPATSEFIEPIDLIDELYDAGSNVITLYSKLAGDAKVEPTAGRLYRVLTAGFSILYTIIVKFHTRADGLTRQNGAPGLYKELSSRGRLVECKAMLRLCTRTMSRMAEQVTSQQLTQKYVGYFNLLCREVLRVVSGEGEVSSGRQLAATPTDGSSAGQLNSSETYHPEVSPGCFSDDLITAQLTYQLPTAHLQPCFCAVFEDPQTQPAGSVPVTWLNATHNGVGFDGGDYDLGSFVAEWNDSTVWEALFGDFQSQADASFIPL
ncbi:zn 2cys6 transcription factor [Colletotrichum kahawae]|uniref:Zn 2cys6 transcription factor n=1 Tax=Colletotrichum kahawae TaxID=34407 RepID=A0AAE0DA69_COLKA|nr:zn 2cys6 transcription factor [Colletotrichum kahawae]